MNDLPDRPDAADAAAAERHLSRVQGKVVAARAVLLRLLQEVVVAEARLSYSQAAQVMEANEQLVVSALLSQAEAQAARRALEEAPRTTDTDPLTQLPNRLLLRDRLTQAMATAKRKGTRLALLFLDLDDFKTVNDTLGHAVGDEVLQQVAQRLCGALREADTVSRHGGDEFLLLLGEVSQRADVARVAGHLQQVLAAPCHAGGQALCLTASIGISLYPDDGEDANSLINRADAAMYRAKHRGAGGFAFHGEPPTDRDAPDARPRPTPHEQALAEQARRNADLREANERLVLAALDAQALQAAAERAQQRQTELMAAVADEMADPSTPIRLASAMLGRARTDEPLLPRVRAIIEQQVTHMSRLVAAANDLSRAGRATPGATQPGSDLGAVMAQVVDQCQPAIALREQRLLVTGQARAGFVQADRERLAQILRNLLDNASKYTHDQGTICIDVAVTGEQVVISVADDGIGITPAAMPRLFEPFVQDSRTIGFNGVGVGIGLPVVRFLVDELGGTVSADSGGDGQGSRFVVTLPRADAPAPD
ncbi:MAG: diguanylate cyclase [Aquabacterium sp.]|nr:diguanylate cyclase [Aquabacterium sp.]